MTVGWPARVGTVFLIALLVVACSRSRSAKNEQPDESGGAIDQAVGPSIGAAMTCAQICEKNLELSYREGAKQATRDMTAAQRKDELRKAELGWVNRRQNKDVMRVLSACIDSCDTTWTLGRRSCENDARDFAAFQRCLNAK